MKHFRTLLCVFAFLWWMAPLCYPCDRRVDEGSGYVFPPVDSLPDNPMMPDPFKKPDGTRVASLEEWPEQRAYLKAMLQHYLYGHVPPRPSEEELSYAQVSDERFPLPNSTVRYRKQQYSITISRNSLAHSFQFTLWRPEELKRYPAVIDFRRRPQLGYYHPHQVRGMEEAVRRGYMGVVLERHQVAPDDPGNADRQEGIFRLYPEYDFYTIAAWAWAYQPVIDVLNSLGLIDMEKIIATGHSRGGQTAMAAGIFDDRIALVAPVTGSVFSVGSFRQRDPKGYSATRDFPRDSIKRRNRHWYHPRFTEFSERQDKLPWDAASMVALIAPRPLLHLNAVGDGVNNGLAQEVGIRVGVRIYQWMNVGKWCRIHWRDWTNQFGQTGHDQGPEEYNAIFDFADEYFFHKPSGPSRYNVAPGTDDWRYDPVEYPLLIDWEVPAK